MLLGYESEMGEMFEHANLGLKLRFSYDTPFYFDNFIVDELMEILHFKMRQQHFTATEDAL